MEFLQKVPFDMLGKRKIRLDDAKAVIEFKNVFRSLNDEYPYEKLNPTFISITRGEKAWVDVIYKLLIAALVLFVLSKAFHAPGIKLAVLGLEFAVVIVALTIVPFVFIRRRYVCVMDLTGDCILSIRETADSAAFLKALKQKIEKAHAAKATKS